METDQQLFNELSFYTLSHPYPVFIHQHVVDAYGAQTALTGTKKIRLIFSLAGLYLYLEKGYSGREVQLFHMRMAKRKKTWPHIEIPQERGSIFVADVLKASPGEERDLMIRKWCESVWCTYSSEKNRVEELVRSYL